jgi:pimeloyl-ACP methyl ester carboxylesterase
MAPFRCFFIDMPISQITPRLKIFYFDENQAARRVILLLHGLGANADSWQLQIPALVAAGYRVIAPDLRGFGRSSYPGKISVPDMAADCAALMEHIEVNHFHVAGISMGGTVAIELGLRYPQHLHTLALINTFAQLKFSGSRHLLTLVRRIWLIYFTGLARQAEWVVNDLFPRPEQELFRQEFFREITSSDPRAYRAAMFALWRYNAAPLLPTINHPTLIITAENDRTVLPGVQAELAQGIPGAQQVMISNAGHAVTAERAEAVNQILLNFLNDPVSFA